MSEYIEKKLLKLKLLTPVHISDGYEGELIPTEYVITDSGQLHKIDLAKLISQLPEDKLNLLNTFLEREDIIGIRNFIKSLWNECQNLFSDSIEYSMNAGDLSEYYNNLQNENDASQLIVIPFIRSGKRTFIPGSSIKGAIRTAFINELFKTQIDYSLNRSDIRKEAQMLEEKTLNYGYRDDETGKWKRNVAKDPFKALKISDAFAPSDNSIVKKIEIVRKTGAGKFDITGMEQMKIFEEVLIEGIVINVEVRLDNRYFNNIDRQISLEQVANSCRTFYRRVLQHERDNYFTDFDKEVKMSRISDLYTEFLNLNESPKSFLLRIGKNSGRNSLSFNLCNKKGVEPKSRKLTIEGKEYLPLGWVCVTMT
ncbi:MAG TPA: type III-A CRISPR-associated RAMP protein Csm5 [Candidatus Wunengus sp. YC63]|uniref:type III-A CRISPR-associated RAMP protein Csm5 n=1 Tax=Candidatus Wunengus sp. YC63 TaxID=3367699 RepID=UPI004028D652